MAKHRDPELSVQISLPKISGGVLKRFLNQPPEFEALYKRLRENDPGVAYWLLSACEQIAPADAAEKEKYSTLALRLYGMLLEQQDVNELVAHLGNTKLKPITRPCANCQTNTAQDSSVCANCETE